jgi:hypothetical protein
VWNTGEYARENINCREINNLGRGCNLVVARRRFFARNWKQRGSHQRLLSRDGTVTALPTANPLSSCPSPLPPWSLHHVTDRRMRLHAGVSRTSKVDELVLNGVSARMLDSGDIDQKSSRSRVYSIRISISDSRAARAIAKWSPSALKCVAAIYAVQRHAPAKNAFQG